MDLIKELNCTKEKTLAYYELPEHKLNNTYAAGKWTVREILVHLADAESVLHERIKRVIAEPFQVLWAFDQDLWCINLDYKNFPLTISRDLYQANRDSILYIAENLYASNQEKTFVHSITGLRTLKEEMEKVAAHNDAHLHQIQKALAG
jgi:hypothetical protein